MGLALDEPTENDTSYSEGELQFLVDKTLLAQCGTIRVDFIEDGYRSGFSITSEHPIKNGNSACGSCSGSCG